MISFSIYLSSLSLSLNLSFFSLSLSLNLSLALIVSDNNEWREVEDTCGTDTIVDMYTYTLSVEVRHD